MTNSKNSLHMLYFILSSTFLAFEAALHYSFPTTMAIVSPSNGTTNFVLPLILRDALQRPSHNNPNINRAKYNNSLSLDVRSPIIPDQEGSTFLVNISIGEPPVPQLLAMDTGSVLTWVQPLLCRGCTPSPGPTYDPAASSTYKPIPWRSIYECMHHSEFFDCRQDYWCTYSVRYLDTSASSGVLAFEKFTLGTSTDGKLVILDLAFGYGLKSNGSLDGVTGILGLQVLNEHSLVSRMGNRFSYCIGNISDPNYPYNRLSLGSAAVIEGFSTPLIIWHGHYAVGLRGIGLGEKNLNIFNGREFDFPMLVDSGTTMTYLERGAFEEVMGAVGNLLDKRLSRFDTGDGYDLCYWGDLRRDLEGFPVVKLVLDEGAEVYMGAESVFRRMNDGVFCMAVEVAISGVNIIGAYAQQYYNVGFDLDAMRVSFLSTECELLDDYVVLRGFIPFLASSSQLMKKNEFACLGLGSLRIESVH